MFEKPLNIPAMPSSPRGLYMYPLNFQTETANQMVIAGTRKAKGNAKTEIRLNNDAAIISLRIALKIKTEKRSVFRGLYLISSLGFGTMARYLINSELEIPFDINSL